MEKLLFKLRYTPTANGEMNGAAVDINRFMSEMGLIKGTHYSVRPIEITDDSFKNSLDCFGGVLLEIFLPDHPFGFQVGIIGGYSLVGDFLKRNKRNIEIYLKSIK